MDNVDEKNMSSGYKAPHLNKDGKKQYLPKPQIRYESERPALSMFDLLQALAVALL